MIANKKKLNPATTHNENILSPDIRPSTARESSIPHAKI
jgi:hypothetical protein